MKFLKKQIKNEKSLKVGRSKYPKVPDGAPQDGISSDTDRKAE
jgi:hypothetical protein